MISTEDPILQHVFDTRWILTNSRNLNICPSCQKCVQSSRITWESTTKILVRLWHFLFFLHYPLLLFLMWSCLLHMFIYLSLFCFVLLEFSPSGIFYTWTISTFDYAKFVVFGLCSVRLSFSMESERRQRNSNTVIVNKATLYKDISTSNKKSKSNKHHFLNW